MSIFRFIMCLEQCSSTGVPRNPRVPQNM